MPGSSLWLLPPATHPLQSLLATLIKDTSARFDSPHLFIPHVTLSSEIAPSFHGESAEAAQKWLDGLALPAAGEVVVKFGGLDSEDVFVRKLYAKVGKEGVRGLGVVARRCVSGFEDVREAEGWAEGRFRPHLSLLYCDCKKVDVEGIAEIERLVKDVGVRLDGEGELGGWTGGRVVLVRTDLPINEWIPLAEKTL